MKNIVFKIQELTSSRNTSELFKVSETFEAGEQRIWARSVLASITAWKWSSTVNGSANF